MAKIAVYDWRRMSDAGLVLPLLTALLGVSPVASDFEAQQKNTPPDAIYGGQEVAAGAYPEVVAIQTNSILCTGTLISSRVVLTAGHCFPGNPAAGSIRVNTGNDLSGPSYEVESYGVHPDFCGDLEACSEDIHDLAYLVLAEPIATSAEVLLDQDDWDASMFVGASVTLVGYGATEDGSSGTKLEVTTEITSFSSTGHEFRAGGDGKDSCQGDSGGPAFVIVDGRLLLAGVTSRGLDCGKGGFYTLPASELCWLRDEAGVDLTSSTCDEACNCLISDPERAGGCCSINKTLSNFEALALAGLCLLGWRLKRKKLA